MWERGPSRYTTDSSRPIFTDRESQVERNETICYDGVRETSQYSPHQPGRRVKLKRETGEDEGTGISVHNYGLIVERRVEIES